MREEMENLNGEELKVLILESHARQLELFYTMAQSEIIMIYEGIEKMIEEDHIYDSIENSREGEILLNSYNNLIKSFNKININMGKEGTDKEIEYLLNIRKGLENLFVAINAYDIEITYISELANYYMMRFIANENYKNQIIDGKEIDSIVDLISHNLNDHSSSYEEFIETISQILGILPFRMTKSKFYNVLETTLKRNLEGYSITHVEEAIINYKLTFDSSYMGDYGVLFDHYFTEIQYYKNMDLKNKELEELEVLVPNIEELRDTIVNTGNFIQTLGIFSNKLIAMNLIKNRISLELSNNAIFDNWLEYIENPKEKSLEELILKCHVELENVEIKFHEEGEIITQLDEEIGELDGETDRIIQEKLMENMDIIKFVGDNEFSKYEILFPKNEEKISEDYLRQQIDSLIGYINRNISNMGGMERKIRMRRLLAYIDLPFMDFEEFIEYIYYALDERVVSKEEIFFTLDALYFILDNELQEEI